MLGETGIPYNIYGSGDLATQPLPLSAAIWIVNDQSQLFYDRYADSQTRFDQFVADGGILVFGACDRGWGGGSLETAGAKLPGDVSSIFSTDGTNYNVNPIHPLMTNVDAVLLGNYASHNYFQDLPADATILAENSAQQPTLVEYNYGNGRVIATGQALEAAWRYGWNTKQIYANLFYYTFDLPFEVHIAALALQVDEELPFENTSQK